MDNNANEDGIIKLRISPERKMQANKMGIIVCAGIGTIPPANNNSANAVSDRAPIQSRKTRWGRLTSTICPANSAQAIAGTASTDPW